eukprot:1961672-Amphidinium_carterae.1
MGLHRNPQESVCMTLGMLLMTATRHSSDLLRKHIVPDAASRCWKNFLTSFCPVTQPENALRFVSGV